MSTMTRALISVSDKTGIVEFAKQLVDLGIEIISTGGTYQLLKQHVTVTEISDFTKFPEIMDGRVKTLHPKVHGGILARRGQDEAVMQANDILPIDLVVVNLYPFAKTIANPDATLDDAIENIDIGGPTMVRAAAKNHAHVGIVVNSSDYTTVIEELSSNNNQLSQQTRFELATKAFTHTAEYDSMITSYLQQQMSSSNDDSSAFAEQFSMQFDKVQDLRYGENPHQRAAFYKEAEQKQAAVANSTQLQGKALSYNNIADADAALECVKSFADTSCVIVKHANPCGVATAASLEQAYQLAYATDPESAFGGIIAFNRPLDAKTAQTIINQQFVEVIIAPSIADDVLEITKSKPNVRILVCGNLPKVDARLAQYDYKRITAGLLIQDQDLAIINEHELKTVTKLAPTAEQLQDLLFSWKVAKYVKSNAIVYARNKQTIGIGAGQMSRVNSARIAAIKAEHAKLEVKGAVMASDAFFPFRDGIDNASKAGISCIIQPGGSMRDEETIAAADEHGIAMVFTGVRHFRH